MTTYLLPLLVKSTVVLGLAGVLAWLLRGRSAAARHLIWCAAFLLLWLMPVGSWLPAAGPVAVKLPGWAAAPERVVMTVTAEGGPGGLPWKRAATVIWLTGVAFLAARFFRAQWAARRLTRTATGEGNVRYSRQTDVPLVCGWLKPVIVLPEEAGSWPADRLQAVLAHERMHLRRRDTITQALAQLACVAYWPQPLAWLGLAQLRRECEQAADDGVLVEGTPASAYAEHLIGIARGLPPAPIEEGSLAMIRFSELEQRVRALLHPNRDRRTPGAAFFTATTVACALLFAGLAPLSVAQGPAVVGVVKDPSGAVVPKARITITDPARPDSFREIFVAKAGGDFSLAGLPDGEYDITVEAPGFARLLQKGVTISTKLTAPLVFQLNVGSITERMTVSAPAPIPAAGQMPQQAGVPPSRIRVGGNVAATNLLMQVRPVYPVDCKNEGIEGTVVLRAVIGKDGGIMNLEALNKLVDQRLVNAAVDAVQQWRYKPTLLNGQPVEVSTMIDINFTLTK